MSRTRRQKPYESSVTLGLWLTASQNLATGWYVKNSRLRNRAVIGSPPVSALRRLPLRRVSSAVSEAVTRRAPASAARSFGMPARLRSSNVENGVLVAYDPAIAR